MITKEINGKEYLFIEVPEDAIRPRVTYIQVDPDIIFTRPDGGVQYVRSVPMADYTTIGKASEITEGKWKEVVEGNNGGEDDTMWFDYIQPKDCFFCFTKGTITESGLSLIQSIGMKPETTLILQKLT